jgi:hypothetical protein
MESSEGMRLGSWEEKCEGNYGAEEWFLSRGHAKSPTLHGIELPRRPIRPATVLSLDDKLWEHEPPSPLHETMVGSSLS